MLRRMKTLLPLLIGVVLVLGSIGTTTAAAPSAVLPRHVPNEHAAHALAAPAAACTTVSLTASPPTGTTVGTTVTLTAQAQCGAGETAEYKWWILRPDVGYWTPLQFDWRGPVYDWDTTGLPPANYQLSVWARHAGATEDAYEAYAQAIPYAIAAPTAGMHEGVPICTDHPPTAWHPLVRRNPDQSIACTYLHEHRTDPNIVNDIFGPPSAWYGGSQEISYPWQTASALGQENQVKHQGYKWNVLRDMPCKPAGDPNWTGCIRAVRVQTHTLGTAADATVRFHSYSFEALVEFQGRQGIIRHGGWLDFGHLALATDGGGGHLCPPLSGDPTEYPCAAGPTRNHSSVNIPAPHVDHNAYLAAWYASHQTTQVTTTFEEWGPIDYDNPALQHYFPPERRANNSAGGLGNMFVGLQNPFWGFSGEVGDGTVTWSGYTDRYGAPLNGGCSPLGPDCVPLMLSGVPRVDYSWNAGVQGELPATHFIENDVASPVTGNSLIRFPN